MGVIDEEEGEGSRVLGRPSPTLTDYRAARCQAEWPVKAKRVRDARLKKLGRVSVVS
jgi:hypothetical protein